MVSGRILYTDSTHLKASANKNKFDVQEVEVKPLEYLQAWDEAIDEDRHAHGKQPLKAKPRTPQTKAKQSQPNGRRQWLHGSRGQAEGLFLPGSPHG